MRGRLRTPLLILFALLLVAASPAAAQGLPASASAYRTYRFTPTGVRSSPAQSRHPLAR